VIERVTKYRLNNKEKIRERKKIEYQNADKIYLLYRAMLSRCYNKEDDKYPRWGGRGIRVCQRWLDSYKNFKADMGERPSGTSLDRIDNNGDYAPDNCRWASAKIQQNNKRSNMAYRLGIPDDSQMYIGERLGSLKEWAEINSIPLIVAKYRYAQHPMNEEWMLQSDTDNRHYTYKGLKYNIRELTLLTNVSYKTMWRRLFSDGWTGDEAVDMSLIKGKSDRLSSRSEA
jgi:hypothetical protein